MNRIIKQLCKLKTTLKTVQIPDSYPEGIMHATDPVLCI